MRQKQVQVSGRDLPLEPAGARVARGSHDVIGCQMPWGGVGASSLENVSFRRFRCPSRRPPASRWLAPPP